MSESGEIEQRVGEARQSAVTTTGDAVVHITNYYYREVSQVDPAESDRASSDDELPCPYRGLFHFEPKHSELFFGREVFVSELVRAVQTQNFIPVLGASGSGKSSVVFAGLVPQLQKEKPWRFTYFRPGNDPFHSLAMALVPLYAPELNATERMAQARTLARYLQDGDVPLTDVLAQIRHNYPNERVLLIGDQFEELYTLCRDRPIRQRFLDRLLTCFFPNSTDLSATVLVVTMRADFLGNALSYASFGDVVRDDNILLRAMNHEELADAIVKPAEKFGVTFEAGLVERILAAVEDEPGNLPLLEFALTELWRQRSGKKLTHRAYEAIGEVHGALARHADESYGKLSDEGRERVRRVFIQLVRPGEGTEDTRRLATKVELGQENWDLVKELADERLVVTSRNGEGRDTVEVVHEALIRHWGELRQWMEVDREFRVWQERLRVALSQWEEAQRHDGALLSGVALGEAEARFKERQGDLSSVEREFIRESLEFRARQVELEEKRRQQELERERQARRVAQRTTAGAVLVGLVMAVLTVMTGIQLRESEIQEIRALNASSKALFASEKKLDALIESLRAGSTLQRSVWQKIWSTPGLRQRTIGILQERVYGVRKRNRISNYGVMFSPDGSYLAMIDRHLIVVLWDAETEQYAELRKHQKEISRLMNSPNGLRLATVGEDGKVVLWDTSGEKLAELSGHQGRILELEYSPDGSQLATAGRDRLNDVIVTLWDVEEKQLIKLKGHQGRILELEYSPDGSQLVTVGEDGKVILWDLGGKQVAELSGSRYGISKLRYSPDGSQLATVGGDGKVVLWDTSGEKLAELSGHQRRILELEYSPDGSQFVTVGGDEFGRDRSNEKKAILWDAGGEKLAELSGHQNGISKLRYSPDGSQLATVGEDGKVVLWDTSGEKLAELSGHQGRISKLRYSPDGSQLATAGRDRLNDVIVTLWDVKGKPLAELSGLQGWIFGLEYSRDGTQLSTVGRDRLNDVIVTLWDVEGKQLAELKGDKRGIRPLAYSPDGSQLATSEPDGKVILWDVEGKQLAQLSGHQGLSWPLAYSPDGSQLAMSRGDGKVILWDTEGEKQVGEMSGHQGGIMQLEYSPDGSQLAASGDNGKVILWDTEGEKLAELSAEQAYSSDGSQLATSEEDGKVVLWDTEGEKLAQLSLHLWWLGEVAYSPDGSQLAMSRGDGKVILWDIEGEKQVGELSGHQGGVMQLEYSPDGSQLATSGGDGKVILWDTEGEMLTQLSSGLEKFMPLAYSPDGSQLATSGDDGKVILWDTEGAPLAQLSGHQEPVRQLTYSPDGSQLATSGDDGKVILWERKLNVLIELGCDWVEGYLQTHPEVEEEGKVFCSKSR